MTEGTQAFGEGDSVDAMLARSSAPLMPGGTFSARKVTFVPSGTNVSVVVTVIVPANPGSTDANETA